SAPTVDGADPAAKPIPQRGTYRDSKIEDGDGVVAALTWKEVGNPTGTDRPETRFSKSDERPEENHRNVYVGMAGQQCAKTPHKPARRHQPAPLHAVAKIAEDRSGQKIAEHERRRESQALPVIESQFVSNERENRRKDIAVEIVEQVETRQ